MDPSPAASRILWLNEINSEQVKIVGGKTASLGEMYNNLSPLGIRVPNGFAITAQGFEDHLKEHGLQEPIKDLFDDPETARVKLLLASYNSGYFRVMSAFSRKGPEWLNAPELRGVRGYVNRIMSYCDGFSKPMPPEVKL